MINVKRALRSERLLKALTGQSVAEFKKLLATFSQALAKTKRDKNPKRQRAIGGGRKTPC